MVNKCVVTNSKTGYDNGPRKSPFFFPRDADLCERWIYFVNRQNWKPTKFSVICVDHFDPKYIKQGKKCKLLWDLSPLPTIQTDIVSARSILRTPAFPRKLPTARCHGKNELAEFQAADKISKLILSPVNIVQMVLRL